MKSLVVGVGILALCGCTGSPPGSPATSSTARRTVSRAVTSRAANETLSATGRQVDGTVLHCRPAGHSERVTADLPGVRQSVAELGIKHATVRYVPGSRPSIDVTLPGVHISKITFYPRYIAVCQMTAPVSLLLDGVDYG